jgi:CBS domain-containing protein
VAQQETVRDAMTDNPRTIGADASVADAARQMRDEDVALVAVVDDGDELIGVITDRDIAILVVAEGADADSTTVRDAMSETPVSVGQDQSLDEAFRRMLEGDVHRAPVTDDGRHVSGMLEQSDAARQGEGRPVGGSGGATTGDTGEATAT